MNRLMLLTLTTLALTTLSPPASALADASDVAVVLWEGTVTSVGCPVVTTSQLPPVRLRVQVSGVAIVAQDAPGKPAPTWARDAQWGSYDHWVSTFAASEGMKVDGAKPNWGSYADDHTYATTRAPNGSFSFQFQDGRCDDNTGAFHVQVLLDLP